MIYITANCACNVQKNIYSWGCQSQTPNSQNIDNHAKWERAKPMLLHLWHNSKLQETSQKVIESIKERFIEFRVIILYSRSTLNAYSLLSQKLWVPLLKFMMGPTTSVREGSTHLMYSQST